MDYYNISYNKKNKYCICLIKKAYYGNKENDVNLNKSLCIIKNCIGVKYKSKFCISHYENYKDLIYNKIIFIIIISIKHFIITLNIIFIYIFSYIIEYFI